MLLEVLIRARFALLLIGPLSFGSGCTYHQLRKNTVGQADTIAELHQQQVLDNLAMFRELMADKPPHVHSFFRGAQLLVKLDRIEDARAALREGIEISRQQGELHAAGEMGELLASLGAAGE